MATEATLRLREIRPHPRAGAWVPNEWRRHTTHEARKAQVTRRRWLRAERRKARRDR